MDVADLVRAGFLKRVARAPALHFLALGLVLFLGDGLWGRPGASARTIVFTAADVAQLRRGFEQQFGRAPMPKEEDSLVDHAIDDEVLYRRALEIGLDRGDRVVRERLVAAMRLVAENENADDDALYREAIGLGLDRSDVVVRRHLVQLMSLLAKRAGAVEPVSDADLARLLERDAERYRQPDVVTLAQVYLDPARRGAKLDADAVRILAALRSREQPGEAGDPFLLGARFAKRSVAEIRRQLGNDIADAASQAPLGEWIGPLRSSYGLHLLRIEERSSGRLPSIDELRGQLAARLLEERGEKALAEKLASLRAGYGIHVERGGVTVAAAKTGGTVLAVPKPARELGD